MSDGDADALLMHRDIIQRDGEGNDNDDDTDR